MVRPLLLLACLSTCIVSLLVGSDVSSREQLWVCKGMICGKSCRSRVVGCGVVIRAQIRDRCDAARRGLGCGPRAPGPDTTLCDIGVVNRQLVARREDCTAALYERLTAQGCEAFRKKNAARPLDEYDPGWHIHVTRVIDTFDGRGNLVSGEDVADSGCPAIPRAYPGLP